MSRGWNLRGWRKPKPVPSVRREIVAVFAATCPSCGGAIAVGDAILWAKGKRAIHVGCAARSVAP